MTPANRSRIQTIFQFLLRRYHIDSAQSLRDSGTRDEPEGSRARVDRLAAASLMSDDQKVGVPVLQDELDGFVGSDIEREPSGRAGDVFDESRMLDNDGG